MNFTSSRAAGAGTSARTAVRPIQCVGDSRKIRTGDEIYVTSNPKGLEESITKGIVSSVGERDRVGKSEDEIDMFIRDELEETDWTTFQIGAAVSPGSGNNMTIEPLRNQRGFNCGGCERFRP